MIQLVYILIAVLVVSTISLLGALSLFFKKKLLRKILPSLVSFAAGALLGAAFFDLFPEALEVAGESTFTYVLVGMVIFFAIEKLLYWYHCHEEVCTAHHHHGKNIQSFVYLNLFGDGVHNFIDGVVIATTFLIDFNLGVIATIAVILHEIPQELGDFGILVYGGFTPFKALMFNFLSACMAIVGAVGAYYFTIISEDLSSFLLPFATASFLYISTADLIPELHHEQTAKGTVKQLVLFILGVLVIWFVTSVVKG